MAAAIEMRTELDAVLLYLATFREAENLVAAAIGEDGLVPTDEFMETPTTGDQPIPRPQHQVICITKDDARANFVQVARRQRLNSTRSADRHEHRCFDFAVCCLEDSTPRAVICVGKREQMVPTPLLSLSEEIARWDHFWRAIRRT